MHTRLTPTKTIVLTLILLLLGFDHAARAQSTPDAFAAVPESDIIVVIDVARILSEGVPRVLATDQATLAQMNASLDMFKNMSGGVDARSLRRIIIAARVPPAESLKAGVPNPATAFRGVVIVEGLDAEKILTLMRQATAGKFVEEKYQDKTVYTMPSKPQPKADGTAATTTGGTSSGGAPSPVPFDAAVVSHDATTLVFGTPAEVRASIDASAGRGPRVGAELVASATRNASSLVSLALIVPPTLVASLPGGDQKTMEGPQGEIMKLLASIRHAYFGVGTTQGGFDVALAGRTDPPEQAKALGDMLTGLRALALLNQPKSDDEKMIQALLKSVQITSAENEFQLKADVPQETVNMLLAAAKKMNSPTKPTATSAPPTPKPKPTVKKRRRTRRTTRR